MITVADLKAALPDLTGTQRLEGLVSGAVIRRDRWGIPHIKADHEYDLFFAQGFATAQDRLFQMDFDRLRALGRAAEYSGARALQQDRLMRRRRIERVSRLDYEIASDAAKRAMDAYADGVNAFIQSTKALPVEYTLLGASPERWEPWQCIAVYKVRNTAESSFQGKLWLARLAAEVGAERAAKLSPGCQPASLLTIPPGQRYGGPVLHAVDDLCKIIEACSMLQDTDGGSNGWVVSGKHTSSGLPLVAGDSHRLLEAPNVYYQVHLIGNGFAIVGYSIPGFPLPLHFCHNEHVGWGMTHAGVDTQDLFVERFREANGQLEYLYKDQWMRASCARETIHVRAGRPDSVDIVETHHGPVIAGDPLRGAAITLADPGSKEGTGWIDAAYQAMKARSADEFEAALEDWTDRVNNYVYADVHGHDGYVLRGQVPVRTSLNGWGPIPGWTGKHEWTGYVPAADLPRMRNPAAGFIVSCNQRIVDETYPYYLTHFCSAPYRAERVQTRIAELIERGQGESRITLADITAIHADVTSIPARALQKALTWVEGLRDKAAAAAEVLRNWNCILSTESYAAALYEMTAAQLTKKFAHAHYESRADDLLKSSDAGAEEHWKRHLRFALIQALEQGDESFVPAGERWASLLAEALQSAVTELECRFGKDPTRWRWGELHRARPQHALSAIFPQAAALLNPPQIETAGDGDTPCVSSWRTAAAFHTTLGSVNRYVHDPADWSRSRWIVPLGASGHPGSIHYADQQQLWAQVETIPQLWDWVDIGRHTETEQVLQKNHDFERQ